MPRRNSPSPPPLSDTGRDVPTPDADRAEFQPEDVEANAVAFERDLRSVRRAATYELLTSLFRTGLFLVLAALLTLVALRLEIREQITAGRISDLESYALQLNTALRKGNQSAQALIGQGKALSEDVLLARQEHPDDDAPHVRTGGAESDAEVRNALERTEKSLTEVETKLQAVSSQLSAGDFEGVEKLAKAVREKMDDLKKNASDRERALDTKVTELEGVRKMLAERLGAAEEQRTQKENEVKDLKKSLAEWERPRPVGTDSGKPNSGYPGPDPDLITLILLIDSDTNLTFLDGELMDLFTYHGLRNPDAEFVAVDVSRGGRLTGGKMTVRPKAAGQVSLEELRKALERVGNNAPNLGGIATELPGFLRSFPARKRKQVILLGGAECSPPAAEAWKKLGIPIHVCIVNDGRQTPATYKDDWKQFLQQARSADRNGEYLEVAVDQRAWISQSVARGQVRTWLEERLLLLESPGQP